MGIASVTHKEFLNVTVICYARHFFNYGEKIGELSDENYEKEEKIEKRKEEPKINFKKNNNTPDQVKQTENKEVNENINKKMENNHVDEDDMDLPEGVAKIERHEKIVTEGNIQKKIIKIKKFKEDGTIEVEIKKENLK